MKIYWLHYTTITSGTLRMNYHTLFEFAKALDKAMENSFVNQDSITFWTTDK